MNKKRSAHSNFAFSQLPLSCDSFMLARMSVIRQPSNPASAPGISPEKILSPFSVTYCCDYPVFLCSIHSASRNFCPYLTILQSAQPSKNNFLSAEITCILCRKTGRLREKETSCRYAFLQSVKNYLFFRLKKAFLPRNCATSSPSSSSMRSS